MCKYNAHPCAATSFTRPDETNKRRVLLSSRKKIGEGNRHFLPSSWICHGLSFSSRPGFTGFKVTVMFDYCDVANLSIFDIVATDYNIVQ